MKHSPLDKYAYKRSPIHSLPISLKFTLTFTTIIFLSLPFQTLYPPLTLLLFCLALFLISKVPLSFIIKRIFMASFFFLPVIFMNPSNPLILFLKVLTSICYLLLFLTTTPFLSLIKGMERIKIPRIFILLTAFGYRYFFLLTDEIERTLMAWRMRNGDMKRWRFKSLSAVVYSSLLRSIKRGERIGFTMKMRGFYEENN